MYIINVLLTSDVKLIQAFLSECGIKNIRAIYMIDLDYELINIISLYDSDVSNYLRSEIGHKIWYADITNIRKSIQFCLNPTTGTIFLMINDVTDFDTANEDIHNTQISDIYNILNYNKTIEQLTKLFSVLTGK